MRACRARLLTTTEERYKSNERILSTVMILEHMNFPTVAEAVHSLRELALRGDIDRDLFDLFLRAGVYATYARKFLHAEQLDGLDAASDWLAPLP